jgi:hypothetical protein
MDSDSEERKSEMFDLPLPVVSTEIFSSVL